MNRLALTLITLVGLSAGTAQARHFNTSSGLLLGIYARPSQGGMRVSSTIPGYSAESVLYHGDVLLRTTVDGFRMYRLRSHWEMENAKAAIGPNQQAAVEFYRPGIGLMYAWVQFTPVYGPAYRSSVQPHSTVQPQKYRAQFKIDTNARQMFLKKPGGQLPHNLPHSGGSHNGGSHHGAPVPGPLPGLSHKGSASSAASLFNR